MADETKEQLRQRIAALENINAALVERSERSTDSINSCYTLFEHNVMLQQSVKEQTKELEARNSQLGKALQDLQNATDQMIQCEKLAALGSLVAGIAHEVNTPLGISVTAASHLEESCANLAERFGAL